MTGSWLSTTVTVIVQRLVLPEASVAWNTTLVLPAGKLAPLAGPEMRTAVPLVGGQLSANVGLVYVTVAVHKPGAALTGAGVGQFRVGASKSFTMTRKVQVLVRPAPSVAFHCTVVMPLRNVAVLVGAPCTVPTPPLTCATVGVNVQLSVAVGVR